MKCLVCNNVIYGYQTDVYRHFMHVSEETLIIPEVKDEDYPF